MRAWRTGSAESGGCVSARAKGVARLTASATARIVFENGMDTPLGKTGRRGRTAGAAQTRSVRVARRGESDPKDERRGGGQGGRADIRNNRRQERGGVIRQEEHNRD